MSRSKRELNNPQSLIDIIPYAVYNGHKIARKQIQNQREQAQLTIAYLERQAKKSVKQLESKQKSLLNYYQIKESRFAQMKMKEQHRVQSEKKLQQQRQANESMRESSFLKRNIIKKQLETVNRKIVSQLKSSISQSERRLSQERQLQRSLLRKKNEVFTRNLINQNQQSRTKSQHFKRIASSIVKKDLICVNENIKERDIETITSLKNRQQRLMSIVQKARNEHQKYDYTLREFKSLPFEQISKKMKSARSRGSQSRRSNSRGDSLFDY